MSMASELKPCPACGKRVDGVHTCNPQLRVSEACARWAHADVDGCTCETCEDWRVMKAHARAIREGKIQEVGT